MVIGAAAPHPDAADEQVNKAAQPPKPIAGEPSVPAAETGNGREARAGRRVYFDGAAIPQAQPRGRPTDVFLRPRRGQGIEPAAFGERLIFILERGPNGISRTSRLHVEQPSREIAPDHRGVPDALDEFSTDARVQRKVNHPKLTNCSTAVSAAARELCRIV